jgi:L-ribulose-5-phosphate 3-epimerase
MEYIMSTKPLAIGVCSWSLQVHSIPELKGFLDQLDIHLVQIACGDPHHAAWDEGENMPTIAKTAGFTMGGAMLGFSGEDYTTPQTIQDTGGFGDPKLCPERIERFQWALDRTRTLGLTDLMLHAGFIPEVGDPQRKPFLDTLAKVSQMALEKGITVAFETGQETSSLLRRTLDDLKCSNLKVNFDPANMLLYDKDDPIKAVELLAPDIQTVHVKDAIRTKVPGTWGEEVPLGKGQVDIRKFIQTLKKVGYRGPLFIEREVGNQQERLNDIAHGIRFVKECVAA